MFEGRSEDLDGILGRNGGRQSGRISRCGDLVRRAHLAERRVLSRGLVCFNPLYKYCIPVAGPSCLSFSLSIHSMLTPLHPSPLYTINPTSLSAMTRTAIEPQPFTIPGPSSEPPSPIRASTPSTRPLSSHKRRRQDKDTATDMDRSPATTGPIRNGRKDDVPRKKKAARACIHCQRAHLTCDNCAYPLVLISRFGQPVFCMIR